MAANASRSRGVFGRIGGFFGQRYKGAKEVIGGAGSGIKGAYVGVGRAFTGGATLNTVYNNKTNTVVRNMRKIAEVLKELEKHSPGITAEYTKRKKRTLREFITALNSNGGTPRNLKLNAATRTLNHYAENAFLNYQKRKANAGKKNTNNRAKRNANFAKAAANRNKLRRNRQLLSLVNSVLNDINGNGTTQVTISNANRTEILNALGAKNMYNAYTTNTGAKSLKGFVAYLNTGRTGNARNLTTMSLLEKAITNAIKNKKSRNEAKTASNANMLKRQQAMRNARRTRLTGTPPTNDIRKAAANVAGAAVILNKEQAARNAEIARIKGINATLVRKANDAAKAAINEARLANGVAVENPLLRPNAVLANNAAKVASAAASVAGAASKNGNPKLVKQAAQAATNAAGVARKVNEGGSFATQLQARLGPNAKVGGFGGGLGGGLGMGR
jgi:hypothetical protein